MVPRVYPWGSISSTVVLTAAHCLYDSGEGRWEGQRFYFPAMAIRDGGTPIKAEAYIIPREFIDSGRSPGLDAVQRRVFDFGIMILEEGLDAAYASVFSVISEDEPSAATEVPDIPPLPIPAAGTTNTVLPRKSDAYRMIVGYSLIDYERRGRAGLLRVSFCPVVPYWQRDKEGRKRYFYAHRCSTTGGMSGSPIFYKEAPKTYRVIGIHRSGDEDDNLNKGVFIDYGKRARIEYWKNNKNVQPGGKDAINTFL